MMTDFHTRAKGGLQVGARVGRALCALVMSGFLVASACAGRDDDTSNHNWNDWFNNNNANQNTNDNANTNLNNNNASPVDTDGDGVPDAQDPCPLDNPDDSDDDGVCDSDDQCPGSNDALDNDGDGVPNACDPCPLDNPDDPDNDGVCTSDDVCPSGDDQVDTDGDGVPDACDACPQDDPDDSDGDGVCDSDDQCPGHDDTVDVNGNGVPDACETATTPGVYDYQRLAVSIDNAQAVDFHPSGTYFVVLERYDLVQLFDATTQTLVATADLHQGSGHTYWESVKFAPEGAYALLMGYDTGTGQGVIFRLDHATWVAGQPSTTGVFTAYTGLPQAEAYVEAVWGPFGDPVGDPVVLGRRSSPYVMTLIQLNEATGDATYLNATATGAGCNDVAYVNNEFGQPGLLVVCGINGFDARYYTEVGGVPEVRTPSEMSNINLGNTAHLDAHPSGDYALIISWSGDAIYRFDAGQLCSYSDAIHFSTRRLWNVRFQQGGARALVTGKKQTISTSSFGGMFEFRNDFFQCPQPLVTCDVNEVSISGFGSAPWLAPDNTLIADVAWRPGCDGGVVVGGYSNTSTDWGFVGTFQLVGGTACW